MILVEDLPSALCYVEALLGSVRLGPRPRAGEACHGCWEGSPLPGMRPTRRWDGSRLMWEIGPLSAVPRTGALPVRGLPWCEVSACAACDCDVAPLRALALVRRAVDGVPMGGGAVRAGPVLGEASQCAGLQWQGFPPLSVFWHLAIARSSLLRAVPVRGVLSWACARCWESLWELSVEVWESAHWELSV